MVYGLWYKVPITHYIEPGWYRRIDVVNPIPVFLPFGSSFFSPLENEKHLIASNKNTNDILHCRTRSRRGKWRKQLENHGSLVMNWTLDAP